MDLTLSFYYLAAGITSLAACIVVALGRFTRPAASICAMLAGLAPWIFIGMFKKWLPQSQALFIFGFFGSAPLFMTSLLLFSIRKKTEHWRIVAGACIAGICAGAGYSYALYRVLLKME
ncbi:MAG: hypothetical protein EOP85_09070 [Verrucomicrobiaceae bacterium]|nr:MAG: hypothetical protein EOP85_09070 [Verrucomicrobiaceae bacterium]